MTFPYWKLLFLSSIFKQLLLKNGAVDFVEIFTVCTRKVIIKAAKRILNSDKICRSYCDFYFGITFLEHSVCSDILLRSIAYHLITHINTPQTKTFSVTFPNFLTLLQYLPQLFHVFQAGGHCAQSSWTEVESEMERQQLCLSVSHSLGWRGTAAAWLCGMISHHQSVVISSSSTVVHWTTHSSTAVHTLGTTHSQHILINNVIVINIKGELNLDNKWQGMMKFTLVSTNFE